MSKIMRTITGACLVALWVSISSPVLAAPDAADKEVARRSFEEGDAREKAGDFAAALVSFQKAHEIMHVPTTGLAVAQMQEKMGRLLDARETAISVSLIPVGPQESTDFSDARKACERLAEDLRGRIPSLLVVVKGPFGPIQIDGQEVSASLAQEARTMDPGKHTVVVRRAGYREARMEISLAERERKSLEIILEAVGAAVVPGAPPRAPLVAPIAPAIPETPPTTEEQASGRHWLTYPGFAVGGVGLAVGTIAGIMSLSKASTAKESCTGNHCSSDAESDGSSSKTFATISNIGFGLGLVGIGAGVYGLLSVPSSPKKETGALRVEPVVGVGSVQLVGRF